MTASFGDGDGGQGQRHAGPLQLGYYKHQTAPRPTANVTRAMRASSVTAYDKRA